MVKKIFLCSVLVGLLLFCSSLSTAGEDYQPSYYARAAPLTTPLATPADLSWFRATALVGASIPHSPEALKVNVNYMVRLEYQARSNILIGFKYDKAAFTVDDGFTSSKLSEDHVGGEARVFAFGICAKKVNPFVLGTLTAVNLLGINVDGDFQNDWFFNAAYGVGVQFDIYDGITIDAEINFVDVDDNKGLLVRFGPSFPFHL